MTVCCHLWIGSHHFLGCGGGCSLLVVAVAGDPSFTFMSVVMGIGCCSWVVLVGT